MNFPAWILVFLKRVLYEFRAQCSKPGSDLAHPSEVRQEEKPLYGGGSVDKNRIFSKESLGSSDECAGHSLLNKGFFSDYSDM